MANWLEKTANIAMVIACTVFSVRYGRDLYRQAHPADTAPPYKAGDTIKDTAELGLNQARMTMVLVTRSSCHFCTQSMPFYRRMADVAKRSGVRVVGATGEEPKVNAAYLSSNQVSLNAVVSTDKNQIHASGTPTLIMVRNDGVVVNSWVGQLQESEENEVLKAMEAGN
jgi:hypothetical protein